MHGHHLVILLGLAFFAAWFCWWAHERDRKTNGTQPSCDWAEHFFLPTGYTCSHTQCPNRRTHQ